MILNDALQWILFGVGALLAVIGALGMTVTMSMFRSGIFLIASVIGSSILLILLGASLLGFLQIMMFIGGMLVMILFMVLFSHDPGGEMMSAMPLSLLEKPFSRGIGESKKHTSGNVHSSMAGMSEMSMTTPIKRLAMILSIIFGVSLVTLIFLSTPWKTVTALPDPNAPLQIGQLLLGKYMIGFEGAGILILLGIFGSVYLARSGQFYTDKTITETAAIDIHSIEITNEMTKQTAQPKNYTMHKRGKGGHT